jgi:hypothetical protein
MRHLHNLLALAVIAFALTSTALASGPSATPVSSKTTNLAPLNEGCLPEDQNCSNVEGSYLVTLRRKYPHTAHLSYIAENMHADPDLDWQIRWLGIDSYSIQNVPTDSLHLLRQEPGVKEIDQSYWSPVPELAGDATYLAPMLEPCRPGNPTCKPVKDRYTVTLRENYPSSSHLSYIVQNIDIDPVRDWKIRWSSYCDVYTISNVTVEHLDIIRRDRGVEEVEEWSWIIMQEVGLCRDPRLAEEEQAICYEEEHLPDCEKPSFSKEERQSCYADTKFLSCILPQAPKEEVQTCREQSRVEVCENPLLTEEEQRFCRDGSLYATSDDPRLSIFAEGRRTCARRPETGKWRDLFHGGSGRF